MKVLTHLQDITDNLVMLIIITQQKRQTMRLIFFH